MRCLFETSIDQSEMSKKFVSPMKLMLTYIYIYISTRICCNERVIFLLLIPSPQTGKDWSHWKTARRFNRQVERVPHIKNGQIQWDSRVFQLNNMVLIWDIYLSVRNVHKVCFPNEVAQETHNNFKPQTASRMDEISPAPPKDLPATGIITLTYIFNGCLWLKYIPECFKATPIIMPKISHNRREKVAAYRPNSFLPAISKLLEKRLLTKTS